MSLEVLLMLIFFFSIFTVVYQRRHLLIVLLRLESVILILILIVFLKFRDGRFRDNFLFIIILSFGAIEARLGLALLVSIARKAGRDLVRALTLRKC